MGRIATHDILAPPEPGFFQMRLVKKGPKVAARIINIDGYWQAEINGDAEGPRVSNPLESRSVMRIWETGVLIEEAQYRYLLDLKAWAEKNAPTHPAANPRKPVDLIEAPPLWS